VMVTVTGPGNGAWATSRLRRLNAKPYNLQLTSVGWELGDGSTRQR